MFVPATPDGELARAIQEGDDLLGESTGERRMKVVERGESHYERNCAEIILGETEGARETIVCTAPTVRKGKEEHAREKGLCTRLYASSANKRR